MSILRLGMLLLSLAALIFIGGCKKKDKKLIQYRSTDFIATTSSFSTNKTVTKDKGKDEEKSDQKSDDDEDNAQNEEQDQEEKNDKPAGDPSGPPPVQPPVTDAQNPPAAPPAGNNNKNSPLVPPPADGATIPGAPQNGAVAPVPPKDSSKVQNIVACVETDASKGEKKGDTSSTKVKESAQKATDCVIKKLGDSSELCEQKIQDFQALVGQTQAALTEAENTVLLANYLDNLAKIAKHKKALEEVPRDVAVKVAMDALSSENKKYVFPKDIKGPLREVFEKYKKLIEVQKVLSRNAGHNERISAANKYNEQDVTSAVNQLNKYLRPETLEDLKILQKPLYLQDIGLTNKGKDADTRLEVLNKLAKLKKNLRKDMQNMIGLSADESDPETYKFLRKDPLKVIDESIEFTKWPFTDAMRLNVYDLVIDEEEKEIPNLRDKLYDSFFKLYKDGTINNDATRKAAVDYFKTKENLELAKTYKERNLPAINQLVSSLKNSGPLAAWELKVCANFMSEVLAASTNTDNKCNLANILKSPTFDLAKLDGLPEKLITEDLGLRNNPAILRSQLAEMKKILEYVKKNPAAVCGPVYQTTEGQNNENRQMAPPAEKSSESPGHEDDLSEDTKVMNI